MDSASDSRQAKPVVNLPLVNPHPATPSFTIKTSFDATSHGTSVQDQDLDQSIPEQKRAKIRWFLFKKTDVHPENAQAYKYKLPEMTLWQWFRGNVGAHLLSAHLLLVFVAFLTNECMEYMESGSLWLCVPAIALLFALSGVGLLYAVMVADPGAMPILDKDLQALETRYYKLAKLGSGKALKRLDYFGEQVYGNYCKTCHHFKDLRTVHCELCGHCIAEFDHHSKFFGCCIGARNFRPFYFYQLCLSAFYSIILGFSSYRFATVGVEVVSGIWFLGLTLVLLIFFGRAQIVFSPFIYTYLIAKGKTAHECYPKFQSKKLWFEEEQKDPLLNSLIRDYRKQNSACRNIRLFLCKKRIRSIFNDEPNVFEYESGNTESKSGESSSTSHSKSTSKN